MFRFKRFSVSDDRCAMKIGTDGVLLGAWVSPLFAEKAHIKAIDIGAGSGLISLMMAQRFESADIMALEIDSNACLDAEVNVAASPFVGRVSVVNDDFIHFSADCSSEFDLMVSNPPFFANGLHAPDNARATARHQSALNYQSIIGFALKCLAPDGTLALISPAGLEDTITVAAEFAKLKIRKLCRVTTRSGRTHSRLLWQISPVDGPLQTSTLVIRNADGAFSDEYMELTGQFYLDF